MEEQAGMLRELYGLDFPPALFQFAAFMRGYPRERWPALVEPLGLSTTGPLGLILRNRQASDVKHRLSMVLHWRFFRDLPEFFTCLVGDTDGFHYGILLDDRAAGFRGAASFYSRDEDKIAVYTGLFDAVRCHVDQRIDGVLENLEYDPDHTEEYQRDLAALELFRDSLDEFIAEHGVRRNERRPPGIPSDTGLDLVLDTRLGEPPPPPARSWEQLGDDELLAQCRDGDPVPALLAGRSLWYWGGAKQGRRAHALLRAGYEATGRDVLASILDLHLEHRNMKDVDLVSN